MRGRVDGWFELIPASDGVVQIIEARIRPEFRANIWVVKGRDYNMLVDSGFGLASLRDNLDFLHDRPTIAIATHSHCDHIGGLYEFGDTAIHKAEVDILRTPTNDATVATGYVSREMFFDPSEGADFDPEAFSIHGVEPSRILSDRDTIDLGDRTFEVIHVPGHSPGGIVLWERSSGILFAGDMAHAGPNGIGRTAFYHANLDDMRKSVEKMLAIPATHIYPGHFDPFGEDKYRSILQLYLDRDSDPNFPLLLNRAR